MEYVKSFYLDKEKDIIVDVFRQNDEMHYVLKTPYHNTGNLIRNLARLCSLPLSMDDNGLLVIRGTIPCYIDGYGKTVYIFRLGNTKVANIYPDGTVEMKAQVPSIAKTLMSQTKNYHLGEHESIVKTYILQDCKFTTDLHTHMNANLNADILLALGIMHQIRYPLYYIRKLSLRCSASQMKELEAQRKEVAEQYADSELSGKYLQRRIDDNTYINFADLILNNMENAAYNIPRIRMSLSVLKDGQAVFTNLEKVYLYRYVFTKGRASDQKIRIRNTDAVPDEDICRILRQMKEDRKNPAYRRNSLFQDKLLWIARNYRAHGIVYAEISDTTLVKADEAAEMLAQVHQVMPAVYAETGVRLRFLAAIRRIPLAIVKDRVATDYFRENLRVLKAVSMDPYVAGSDILGEEINDIRDLKPVIGEIVRIAKDVPGYVIRIHAGENDSLRDNVANSIRCVREALEEGQKIPMIRIGHGLYTANLQTAKGQNLIRDLKETGAVLEFQITSNVRLNNLSSMKNHPLKTYLSHGLECVQGTDGGALYGTDSMDEQLALERFLDLSAEEMRHMKASEERVLRKAEQAFAEKMRQMPQVSSLLQYYRRRISSTQMAELACGTAEDRQSAEAALAEQFRSLPEAGLPVIIAGGSFNNDRHVTRIHKEGRELIDKLLAEGDPQKMFFVIGHQLKGYEAYLLQQNGGRFTIFAIVPKMLSEKEIRQLKQSGVQIRVSIETSAMGMYKSFAYEIFNRRRAALIAFDGNSAGANMIQEARNGRQKSLIFVSRRSRALKAKAASLQGYVTLFMPETEGIAEEIIRVSEEITEDPSAD